MALSLLHKPQAPAPAPVVEDPAEAERRRLAEMPMSERLRLEAAKHDAELRDNLTRTQDAQRRMSLEHQAQEQRRYENVAGAQRNWAAHRDELKAKRGAAFYALRAREGEVGSRHNAGDIAGALEAARDLPALKSWLAEAEAELAAWYQQQPAGIYR